MEIQQVPREQIFPSNPPDHIFKYRVPDRQRPSSSVAQDYYTWLFNPIEYKEHEGMFTSFKGIQLKQHGFAFADAVYAVNSPKRFLVQIAKILTARETRLALIGFLLTRKKVVLIEKVLVSFNEVAWQTLSPYYLKEEYYSPCPREILKFINTVLRFLGVSEQVAGRTSETIAMLFEFDNAYRIPFEDLMSETSAGELIRNFPKEITRLLQIQASRDNVKTVHRYNRINKFKDFGKLLRIVWLVPNIRKSIIAGIQTINFKNWQLDDSDIFFTYLWADYNVAGRTQKEREALYRETFGNDQSKMPPQIRIQLGDQHKINYALSQTDKSS